MTSKEPTREQMAERIRQKLTETMFWLQQAADAVPNDAQAQIEIQKVIEEIEKLDMNVGRAFQEAATENGNPLVS